MIDITDIPSDEETHHCISASTGTKYSAYINFREKYTCKDLIESILDPKLSPLQRIHCLCAISVTWDDVALHCYDELLTNIPDYKISEFSTVSSLVMECLSQFASESAIKLVKKFIGNSKVKGTKYTLELIEHNIKYNKDPAKTWGKANVKC